MDIDNEEEVIEPIVNTVGKIESTVLDTENSWDKFGLDDRVLKAIYHQGWKVPSLVQSAAIPLALEGKDILAKAKTGSGKTAAYSVPIVQMVLQQKERELNPKPSIKAVVLVPSRELVRQVTDHFTGITKFCKNVTTYGINADLPESEQKARLAEKPDILMSTPGKLLDYLKSKDVILVNTLKMVVIDEADLMLSFGYEEAIQNISTYFPKLLQSFLMSATLSTEINGLKKLILHTPAVLQLEEPETTTKLSEYYVQCKQDTDKFLLLYALLRLKIIPGKALIFVNDLDRCYEVKLFLERFSIKSAVLNSELPFNSRYHTLQQFNRGVINYLLATDDTMASGACCVRFELTGIASGMQLKSNDKEDADAEESAPKTKDKKRKQTEQKNTEYNAARGIDFKGINTVVNFDFPEAYKNYVHRIGRTARGRAKGNALSLLVPSEMEMFTEVLQSRAAEGAKIKPYQLNWKAIEAFRYRVEGESRTITRTAIQAARVAEIKMEILNSEKLQAHFAQNPKELDILRHDVALQESKVQKHLAYIPDYLVPTAYQQNKQDKAKGVVAEGQNPLEADDDIFGAPKKKRKTFKKKKGSKHKKPIEKRRT